MERCDWPSNNALMIQYHDDEWGTPLHDDAKLFEYLVLDAFQAGLSWQTILNKRENFRQAFDSFDFQKIALYDDVKIEELMNNAGIIRNRLKIKATIGNAKAFISIQREFGSFDNFIWQFTNHQSIDNELSSLKVMPVKSAESDAMSKALIARGFKFVGSTICYAFMQAAGMMNDHLLKCYRHEEVKI
jgi:DNA-3-methyladenine glycosylase I